MKLRKYIAVVLLAVCACALGLFAACISESAHGHNYGEWTDVVNTCSEHIQKRICEDCGNEQIQATEASGHTYGDWTDFVNTCEKHVQKRVCTKCENEQTQQLTAKGHSYGIWADLVNNCTEHVQKRVCYSCGNEQTKLLDATGHNYGNWTDVVNTCEEHVQKRVCSVCKNEETQELEAAGHKYGEWTDLVNTCEEHLQKRECSVCGNVETQEIEVEGHSYGAWADIVNTCEVHLQKRECSVCGNVETQELEAAGHKYGEWTDVVNTCEFYAQKRVCSECKNEETRELEVAGHKYSDWTDIVNTCEIYTQKRVCSKCKNEEIRELEAAGHKYGEWTDLVNTCEEHVQKRVCLVCENVETRELEATGHKYGDWTDLVNTCEKHLQKYVCSECENEQTRELEAEGHKYSDWTDIIKTCEKHLQKCVCSECGNEQTRELRADGHKLVNGICKNCGVTESFAISRYNGTYGLNYFVNNGFESESELYYRIDNAVRAFHVNGENAENDGDGKFVFAEVEYADLDLTEERAVSVWKTYKDDNPLYYWFANTTYINGDNIVLLTEEEYSNGNRRKEYNDLVYAEVKKYAALTDKNDDAYRVALCYHDAIIEAVDYAYDGIGRPQSAAWAHNILGVIEKKGAVCESYARTFQLLLNYSGVENIFVTGDAGEAHAWNLVKLDDGNWYWCDLTWDDTSGWEWGISYYYFMVNDTQNVRWCDGTRIDEKKSFTDLHTAATPYSEAQNFLYGLPVRAENEYTANESYLLRDTFIANGYTYAVAGYNTVQLTEINVKGNIVVPETVTADDGNTYTVISIGELYEGLFNDGCVLPKDEIECSVTIPATVRFIWGYSLQHRFAGWGYPKSASVSYFNVDSGNEWFTAVDGVLFTKSMKTLVAYPSANKRESYTIPDEVEQVAYGAFAHSENLKNLDFGGGVGIFGIACWGRYYDDSHNIIISELQDIINFLAKGATITVDNNPYYTLEDGIIYSGDGTCICAIVQETETIVIKASVTRIKYESYLNRYSRFVVEEGNEAFALEGGLLYSKDKTELIAVPDIEGEVRLADELLSIYNYSVLRFHDKITKISIGSNVKSIGQDFCDSDVKELEYRGTMEEWLAIKKHEKWLPTYAKFTKITCTDGVLDVNGNILETYQ